MSTIWIVLIIIAVWIIGGAGIIVFDFYTIRAGFGPEHVRLDWKDIVAFGILGIILTALAYTTILIDRKKDKPLWPISPENIGSL
jgi:hypothetical protein